MELNIFDINKQPLDYDEVRHVCLIEEINDEAISEDSLEDPEVECSIQYEDDLDLDGLSGQSGVLYESSLEDPEIECYAPSGGDLDFSDLLQQTETMHEQAKAILDHIPETQPDCGETTKLSFPAPYSSAIESPELISESKWVGPIHVWPRWPSVTMGRKKDNELFQTRVQRGWQGCIHNSKLKAITRKDHFPPPFIDPSVARLAKYSYYCVFDGYSNYNHVTLDPGKQTPLSHLSWVHLHIITCHLDHATHLPKKSG
jgi:hypothetical protein